MTDNQIVSFIGSALKHSDHIVIDLARHNRCSVMKIHDLSNGQKFAATFYKTGRLVKTLSGATNTTKLLDVPKFLAIAKK